MREIKFRAWDKEANHMYYNSGHVIIDMKGHCFNLQTGVQLEPLLFTGLYDKNGKEIYEGDILKWKCSHGAITGSGKVQMHTVTIEWGHLTSAHGYSLTIHKGGDKYAVEKSYWNKEDRKIIGNIYVNPELVKP